MSVVVSAIWKNVAPPEILETTAQLADWVSSIAGADVVGVDTESDSFHHYQEKVCLIQMTAQGRDIIVDPLAMEDVQPLADFFANAGQIKIFHDACYDLICLRRDFGFQIAGIFDTMIASRLLGERHFGLAALLDAHYGFTADKRLQRSDWAHRPLTPAQLDYARFDTHFLPDLAAKLQRELVAQKRWSWAQEDFARLPEVAGRLPGRRSTSHPDAFWRVRGMRSLSPEERGRVRALFACRNTLAQRVDKPAFKIFPDEVLIALAEANPRNMAGLQPQSGLRPGGVRRFGRAIIDALRHATPETSEPPEGLQKKRRSGKFLDPVLRARYEALRGVRTQHAEKLGLEPEVLLGNAVLETLSKTPPASDEACNKVTELNGWRGPILNQAIVATLTEVGQREGSIRAVAETQKLKRKNRDSKK